MLYEVITEMAEKLNSRIQAISLVHQLLIASQNLSNIPIRSYVEELAQYVKTFRITSYNVCYTKLLRLASHLRDSWLAMIDPAADAPYSSLFDFIDGAKDYRLGKTDDPSKVGVAAEDERTLVVRLSSSYNFV